SAGRGRGRHHQPRESRRVLRDGLALIGPGGALASHDTMTSSQALQMLVTGSPPRGVRLAAARAMLPLVPSEMLSARAHLSSDPDQEIASTAEAALRAWPEAELRDLLASPSCTSPVLAHFAAGELAEVLLEAVAGNASTPDDAITQLAGR